MPGWRVLLVLYLLVIPLLWPLALRRKRCEICVRPPVSNEVKTHLEYSSSPLPPQCPRRFLYTTTTYGQHNNQLIALLHAHAISKLLNRTLVVGYFVFTTWHSSPGYNTFDEPHVEKDRDHPVNNSRLVHPTELYDFSAFRESECLLFHNEFFGLLAPINPPGECFRPNKSHIRLKDVRCTRTVITRRPLGDKAVALGRSSSAQLTYWPETYWLKPSNAVLAYHLLRPNPTVLAEVRHFQRSMLGASPGNYTAVHLRVLKSEGYSVCNRSMHRLLKGMPGLGGKERELALRQCKLDWGYVEQAQRETGRLGQRLFLATDRQNNDADLKMTQHGAVPYRNHGVFRAASPHGLLVDFWLMVESDLFLGNMASSVDWNVCQVRKTRGLGCHNFYDHEWPRWSGPY